MDRDDRGENPLAQVREATSGIAPEDGFTEAVMVAVTQADQPEDALAIIARATRSLDADRALVDAVMARATGGRARAEASWMASVVRTGPIAVGLAALVAAACSVLWLSSRSDFDATLASSADTVEVLE